MRAPAALPCALPPGPGRGRRGTEPPGCAERASRRGAAAQVAAGGAVFVRPFVGPGRAAQGRAEGPGRAGQPRGDGRAVRCGAVPCRGRSRTALGCGCAPRAAGLPRAGLLGYTLKLLHSFFLFPPSGCWVSFPPPLPASIYYFLVFFPAFGQRCVQPGTVLHRSCGSLPSGDVR